MRRNQLEATSQKAGQLIAERTRGRATRRSPSIMRESNAFVDYCAATSSGASAWHTGQKKRRPRPRKPQFDRDVRSRRFFRRSSSFTSADHCVRAQFIRSGSGLCPSNAPLGNCSDSGAAIQPHGKFAHHSRGTAPRRSRLPGQLTDIQSFISRGLRINRLTVSSSRPASVPPAGVGWPDGPVANTTGPADPSPSIAESRTDDAGDDGTVLRSCRSSTTRRRI
jgi:hypothetical protein